MLRLAAGYKSKQNPIKKISTTSGNFWNSEAVSSKQLRFVSQKTKLIHFTILKSLRAGIPPGGDSCTRRNKWISKILQNYLFSRSKARISGFGLRSSPNAQQNAIRQPDSTKYWDQPYSRKICCDSGGIMNAPNPAPERPMPVAVDRVSLNHSATMMVCGRYSSPKPRPRKIEP